MKGKGEWMVGAKKINKTEKNSACAEERGTGEAEGRRRENRNNMY